MKTIENEAIDIEYRVIPQEFKINMDKNFNYRREAAIEIMEMCAGIYRDPRITRQDYTRFIPLLVERGIIEESSPGIYRLTQEYADPR